MSFDFKSYLYNIYLLLFGKLFNIHRLKFLIFVSLPLILLIAIIRAAYILDNVFYSRYRKQDVKNPIFIVGIPRSGTTFLFRLLSKNENKFTYFKFYDILFPSILIRKAINLFVSFIKLFKLNPSNWMNTIEKSLFKNQRHLHEFSFNKAEEDDGPFVHCFHTPIIYLLIPYIDELNRLAFFDNNMNIKQKKRFMSFYEGCIKRQIFLQGKEKTFLSKNVWGLGKLKALKDQFHDARFLYVIRNPYDSIGSLLSYYYFLIQKVNPDIKVSENLSRSLVEIACNLHLHAHNIIKEFHEDSFIIVNYDDLVSDPKETVKKIYIKWKMSLDNEFAAFLEEEADKNKKYKSQHNYSLEQYGVSKNVIYEKLNQIFEKYHFTV